MKKPQTYEQYRFECLSPEKIAAANAFADAMKAHYNFLPNYDFSNLITGHHPFWRGLKLDDFHLIYNLENQIVGIYGLWDQKPFKRLIIWCCIAPYAIHSTPKCLAAFCIMPKAK